MGFRNRRRHRGGGGGGGHQHHGFFGGEANGMQPGDDAGNRKSFKPVPYVPEDLGNRRDPDEAEWVPEDDVGNRVFDAPTHELSGTLLDLDGKRRRRRPKGVSAPERIGRFLVGGVNPLVAGGLPRPGLEAAHQAFEATHGAEHADDGARRDDRRNDRNDRNDRSDRGGNGAQQPARRERKFESPDGAAAAHDVSDRRVQRFFDFAEDDRFDYTLKSTPEQKRREGEEIVAAIVKESGRDATVVGKLLEDGSRPKVLVTIEERGPAADLAPERRGNGALEPLFMLGTGALMSLNYIANKVVNRFPDDRIRLAVLPAADEKLYLESLAEHQRTRTSAVSGRPGGAPAAPTPPSSAASQSVSQNVSTGVEVIEAPSSPAPLPLATREEPATRLAAHTEPVDAVATSVEDVEELDEAPKKKARAKKAAKDDDETPVKKKVRAKAADDDDKKRPVKKVAKKTSPAIDRVVLKR